MIKNKKDNQLGINSAADMIYDKLSVEAKNMLAKISNQEKLINYKKLDFGRDNSLDFHFSDYRSLNKVFKAIYYRKISIDDAEGIQEEFKAILSALEGCNPRKPEYITTKNNLLINAKHFYDGREEIINAFKNKIFPFKKFDNFGDYDDDDDDDDHDDDFDKRPDDDKSDDEFYTPRELKTISELSNYENEEEIPRDMPDLETEESAEK